MGSRARWALLGPPAVATTAYLVVPPGTVAQVLLYQSVTTWTFVLAVVGVRVNRPVRARVWWAVVAGSGAWVVGDVIWAYAAHVAHVDPFPSAADVFFLAGYLLMGTGVFWLVRGRQSGRDRAALLDSAIVTTGVGVVVGVFLVAPLAADSSQSVLGRAVGSTYPLCDLLLLGMLVRLVSTPGARSPAFRLLVAALGACLVADAAFNVVVLVGDGSTVPRVLDAVWLASYVLVAATTLHPSVRTLSEPAPEREESLTRRRLAALAAASALAPLTLLAQQALGRPLSVLVVALGSLVLSALVLVRMAGLLERVRSQAVQLAALAARDALTGVANRRTWDLELSGACASARDDGRPLTIALLDLDHFKAFNDEHGHQAGDRLLVDAAARWTAVLAPGQLLARYGGEEFAVLLPGCDAATAAVVLERLRAATPARCTASVGAAVWDPAEAPAAAVARADEALYTAKRAGRDRLCVAVPPTGPTALSPVPSPRAGAVPVPVQVEPRTTDRVG